MDATDSIVKRLKSIPCADRLIATIKDQLSEIERKCAHRLSVTTAKEVIPFWVECWETDLFGSDWVEHKSKFPDSRKVATIRDKLRRWEMFDFLFDENHLLETDRVSWKVLNLKGINSCYQILGKVGRTHQKGLAHYYWFDLAYRPYYSFLDSQYWNEVRKRVKERDGHKCQICGSEENLQAHHKTYEFRGREHLNLETLETICLPCHRQHHVENGDKLKDEEVSEYERYCLVNRI